MTTDKLVSLSAYLEKAINLPHYLGKFGYIGAAQGQKNAAECTDCY